MKESIHIFWFRRDLRLNDNCGLFNALKTGKKVLPIFIFDKNILTKLPKDDARVTFIHQQLTAINKQLKTTNSSLAVYHGDPKDVLKTISEKHNIKAVYTNHDYEPYANDRDQEIKALLAKKEIDFISFKDQVIFEKDEIVKKDGTPYKVYTPYSKKWLELFNEKPLQFYPSQDYLECFVSNYSQSFLSLEEIGFTESKIKVTPYKIGNTLIDSYEETRNFPSKDSTSKLGSHLRFGTVSVREMAEKAAKSKNITFLKELIWREFFMQILWHYPHTTTKSFKPQYDRIVWRYNEKEFNAWCNGETGYPLVDAGMRELNKTGFMHNRVRMLVGSFLCKHLLIDWRLGEAYFAEKLHDYEQSSNIGNWQWVAGCGVDAAPYFRIFNPTTQIVKFDKELKYIKKWVPNFQEFNYPKPIVEHKFARERCLETYKKALKEF